MKHKISLSTKTCMFAHLQRNGTIFLLAMIGVTSNASAQTRVVLGDSLAPKLVSSSAVKIATTTDLDQEITFSVPMRMRNFEEFQSRVEKGESIPEAEKVAKYYPLASDLQAVKEWALAEGLSYEPVEEPELNVFVRGKASQIAKALQVRFEKKQSNNAVYLSALNAPAVPADIARVIWGVNGLQPEYRSLAFDATASQAILGPQVPPTQPSVTTAPPFSPVRVYNAYNGQNLPATGTNQAIAIVGTYIPLQQDLQTYWDNYAIPGAPKPVYSNFFPVTVAGTSGPADTNGLESTLDVEWASSVAPSSQIVFYYARNYNSDSLTRAYQRILSDIKANAFPNLHQVSLSFGAREDAQGVTQALANQWSSLLSSISSYGVTVFAASGDSGSGGSTAAVNLPASIPSVTGVGGTTLQLDGNTGLSTNETAWSGSGGGASRFFTKPSYQTGLNVPNDGRRDVPDVAMVADPNTGGIVCWTDTTKQNPQQAFYEVGGTSLSSPIVAAICARVNQARSDFGLGALGNSYNQLTYSLIQTSAYRDITSGSNGAYGAGPAYNQVTGCGVPRIASLFHSTSVPFFTREVDLGSGVYWLGLSNGDYFGYYNYNQFPYIYHYDFGYMYAYNTTDSQQGFYFSDTISGDSWYTTPTYPFPYLYDFTLGTTLYYKKDPNNPGHYSSNPRYFGNTANGQTITR